MDVQEQTAFSIAKKLREARKMAGLSQGQVAIILGLHRPSVSEIEAGNRRVSAEELQKLCEIYEVSMDWAVGRTSDATDPSDPRLELAARELAKLDPENLSRLLKLVAAMNSDDNEGAKG